MCYLVVEPEDVVIDADLLQLDEGLDVPQEAEHGAGRPLLVKGSLE